MPRPRVLVVEDEPLIRSVVVETLADAGFEVEEAPDSDMAAEMLEADGYRLLITDVHMPGDLDGLELAALAHEHDPDIAVVVVTGRPDIVRTLASSGVRGVALAKPFTLTDLVTVVRRYVKCD